MNITHIEHIGIAVKNLENSISYWEKVFKLKCSSIEVVPEQKLRSAFFQIEQTRIELFECTNTEGSIALFIKKCDEGIFHLAFAGKKLNYEDSSLNSVSINFQLLDEQSCKDAVGMSLDIFHPKLKFDSHTQPFENKNQIPPLTSYN